MIIDKEKIQEAKEILGDQNAVMMAEMLQLEDFDEHNLKALCCFHAEDTPSLIYNPKNYTFHCFGCQKTVDIIDVFMQTQNCTYIEAVKKLFEAAGVRYSFGEANVKTRHQYIYPKEEDLNNDRTSVYAYLAQRGISKETADYLDIRADKEGNMVFNYYDTNDVLTMVKYRPSHRIDKRLKQPKCWCQQGADTTPLLYNLNRINTNEPLIIAEGECFSGDAEILTPDGWVMLKDYAGQPVMQVDESLSGSFVKPLAYVKKEYDGDMVQSSIYDHPAITTTAKHNWVYMDKHNKLYKIHAEDRLPRKCYIPMAINYDGCNTKYTNDELALLLVVSADGSIIKRPKNRRKNLTEYYVQFGFNKERKIKRCRDLCIRMNLRYKEYQYSNNTYFRVDIPELFASKLLSWDMVLNTSVSQKHFIVNEVAKWDGTERKDCKIHMYYTVIKQNAEIIQTVASTCGYKTSVTTRLTETGKTFYIVRIILGKNSAGTQQIERNKKRYHTQEMVYCVSVPSGMILVKQHNTIYVSGNCDAAALIESGFHNAVSVPLGASNTHWISENWDWLEQFSSIIICSDNDEPGIKLQKEAVYRLGSWRTKVVDIPLIMTSKKGREVRVKDVNEVLYYCGKEAVINLIANAKDTPVPSVVDFSDVKEVDLSDIDGCSTEIEPIDKETMRLFYGSLTILSGTPGSGKTSFLCQLIAHSIDRERNVWLFSRELPDWMTKNWIEYILAGNRNITEYEAKNHAKYYKVNLEAKQKMSEFYRDKLRIYRDEYPNTAEEIKTSMIDSVRKYGSKLCIIDNLMTVDLGADSNNMNEKQTEFVNWLIQFAMKYNVAVVLVCHPRKLQTGVTNVGMYDISGSSNIINLAHRAFGLRRVTPKEKEGIPKQDGSGWKVKPIQYDVIFEVIKDRMRGKANLEVGLYYDVPSRRFYTNPEEYDFKFSWDNRRYTSKLPYPMDDSEVFGEVSLSTTM